MSFTRRSFLTNSGALFVGGALLPNVLRYGYSHAQKEVFWSDVRAMFPVSKWSKVHLNSGSAGVMATPVQDHLIALIKEMNERAPYEVWNDWQEVKKSNLERLAAMVNCDDEELQIVRNTTEALNMIIYGLALEAYDEVIVAEHDYPFALNAYTNRAARDGIALRKISCPLPADHDTVVACYESAITPLTKVIHLTWMTHHEGHIMPVDQIVKMAHDRGIQVVLDGAHTVAQIDVDLKKINADYFASSLHKWLNAPHGTGLLYVRKDLIGKLHNHPSSFPEASDSINKYEHIGTRAFHQEIGVSAALDFHDWIGFEHKKERLQELKRYWFDKVKKLPNVKMHSFPQTQYSAAVACFSIAGQSGSQILKKLDKVDIHAKIVGTSDGSGIRVSVNLYTTFDELDRFVDAVRIIAS